MSPIYQPEEDSYLLKKTIKTYLKDNCFKKSISILDMGSGSGIQASACKKSGFKNIIAADINPKAVEHLKSLNIKAIKSNLFSNPKLKNKKFDLIIFNPPYLPEDKREPKDSKTNTTAGKKGYEIIIKFLKQAKHHLKNKNSSILLLFSSLSRPKIILKKAKTFGYNYQLLSTKRLFFEELFVFEFKGK